MLGLEELRDTRGKKVSLHIAQSLEASIAEAASNQIESQSEFRVVSGST